MHPEEGDIDVHSFLHAICPLKVFISAGEASGDAFSGRLMAALREAAAPTPVEFYGIGGCGARATRNCKKKT